MRGQSDIVVRQSDVLADAERMTPEARASVLTRPEQVTQLANALYVRRVLAAEAEAAGLAADPRVAAALRLARDRVLSDARLERIKQESLPDAAVIARYAESQYKAQPERFRAEERVRVRHILIRGSSAEARTKAAGVLGLLRTGADFASLAREMSEDATSAARGGDLGFFPRGRMLPAFEQAAFALAKPGDLSAVVETEFGFHIIRLEERRPAGLQPYDEIREALEADAARKIYEGAREAVTGRIAADAKPDSEAIRRFTESRR